MIPSELFFSQNPSSGSLKAFSIRFRSESWPFQSDFIWSHWNHNAGHILIGLYFWPWNAARRWQNPTWLPETTVRTLVSWDRENFPYYQHISYFLEIPCTCIHVQGFGPDPVGAITILIQGAHFTKWNSVKPCKTIEKQ